MKNQIKALLQLVPVASEIKKTRPNPPKSTYITKDASSGLGRAIALAIALAFAAQGARLIVCADLKSTPNSSFMAEEPGTPTDEVICRRYGEGKAIFVQTNVTISIEVEILARRR